MKLKSPIAKYKNEPIYITLPYGDKSFVEAYKRLGWNLAFHNGMDCVNSADPIKAYGTPVFATQDGFIQKVQYTTSVSTKGNGVVVQGDPFTIDGKRMMLSELHWHLADVCVNAGDRVKAGQKIGSLGNTGFTIGGVDSPMKGTHNHFGVFLYIYKDKWELAYPDNGVNGAVDPEDWLDPLWKVNAPIYSPSKFSHLGEIGRIIGKSIRLIMEELKK